MFLKICVLPVIERYITLIHYMIDQHILNGYKARLSPLEVLNAHDIKPSGINILLVCMIV